MRADADDPIYDKRHHNMRADADHAKCDAIVITICAQTLRTQVTTQPSSQYARRRRKLQRNRPRNMRADADGACCDASVIAICVQASTTQVVTQPSSQCARRHSACNLRQPRHHSMRADANATLIAICVHTLRT